MIPYRETTYGFKYGPALVERLFSSSEEGWIVLGIQTLRHSNPIQLYITKTGKIAIYTDKPITVCPSKRTQNRRKETPEMATGMHPKDCIPKLYIGAKLIRAVPSPKDGAPGYTIYYPDGYESWSPKETFETAYREVTQQEFELALDLCH